MSQLTQINTKQSQSDDEMEIDLLELFYYLKKKLVWLIGAFVIGALIAGLYTKFMITPKYQATSKIYMVSSSNDSVVDLTDLNIGTTLSEDYIELLQVRPVFEDVIKKLNLSYTVKELKDMVSIATVGETRIIAVTVTSTSPKEAKDIANEIADLAVTYIPKVMETAKPNIAETAIVPQQKSSPSLAKNTIIGALLALLLMAGIHSVHFIMDDVLKTGKDIEKLFGVMPLTIIPEGNMNENNNKTKKKNQKKKGA